MLEKRSLAAPQELDFSPGCITCNDSGRFVCLFVCLFLFISPLWEIESPHTRSGYTAAKIALPSPTGCMYTCDLLLPF